MVRLVLVGAPGAGKGTQAQMLAKLWRIPHISTGDILRAAVASQTNLGVQAQSYMDRGELVPDDLVIEMIRERLNRSDAHMGWILDGFPRNTTQADSLDRLLVEIDQADYCVVNLDVPPVVLLARMLGRGRADDSETVIRRRLEIYQQQTAPLINFYRDRHRLLNVNGDAEIADITSEIKQVVDDFESSASSS